MFFKKSYEVNLIGGLFTFNTRRGTYYYKINKPKEVWGNYMTRAIFFDRNEKIYYNPHVYIHTIPPYNLENLKLNFVVWSPNEESLLFFEYKQPIVYTWKIIDLYARQVYEMDMKNKRNEHTEEMVKTFTKHDLSVVDYIKLGFKESKIINHPVFSLRKWYP